MVTSSWDWKAAVFTNGNNDFKKPIYELLSNDHFKKKTVAYMVRSSPWKEKWAEVEEQSSVCAPTAF